MSDAEPDRRAVLVVGVNFRARSLRAVAHSLEMLAKGVAREVHLVHVLERELSVDRALRHAVPDAIAQLATDMGGAWLDTPVRAAAWAHVRSGVVAYELRRLAFDVGANMIVTGERAGTRASDVRDERDPLAPFSLLVVGREVALHSRGFDCARCPKCAHLRLGSGADSPWCPEHVRPGARAKRIVRVDSSPRPRLVH